ncbi:MAG TPA: efflux RND transporter periplasmic adaptor subunit [Hyphomicrobiaceae bacterium]|nr:efflux RND transporter periplasmic adaptor subunit [Hyphomicrobiaceae bacterium]
MRKGVVSVLLLAAAAAGGAGYLFGLPPGVSLEWASKIGSPTANGKKSKLRPAAPVTAARVVEADMPVILRAPGTVEPLATVAVKPRVDGQIIEVAFREGDLVEKGSVLFQLDDRLVKAQIAQAEANIAKDEASLRDAQATLARRRSLIDKQVVTEAALDQARFAVEGLKASIAAGRAQLDTQKTQLDYLTIRAPITGRTGSLSAKLGAQVRAQDAMPLITINQTRPILVSFSVPQRELPAIRHALATKATAQVTLPAAERATVPATIAFIDNQVDKQTGAIVVKVQAENTDETLWPGQAVEVALTVEVKERVLSAPASAVLPAQQGMIAWVIGPDNKVAPRVVTVERIVGQTVFLQGGVGVGERVVTDGQLRLAPGATVIVEESEQPPATTIRIPAMAPAKTPDKAQQGEQRRADGRG